MVVYDTTQVAVSGLVLTYIVNKRETSQREVPNLNCHAVGSETDQ